MLGAELLSDQPDAADIADSAWSQALSSIHNRLWFLPLSPLSSPAFCGHSFLPLLLISGQCELWSQMQLLWVCGLADSLQTSLLSNLQPIFLALHRPSAVHTVEKITQSSSVFFSYFLLQAFSQPASLSGLISGVISELHLFHILQRRLFLNIPNSESCSA